MPDLTMASAMPSIISSLTLQANLFQEFNPMGGVRAMVVLFSCAERPAVRFKTAKTAATTCFPVFMRCFYQKRRDICTKKKGRGQNGAGDKSDLQSCRAALLSPRDGGFRWAEAGHGGWWRWFVVFLS